MRMVVILCLTAGFLGFGLVQSLRSRGPFRPPQAQAAVPPPAREVAPTDQANAIALHADRRGHFHAQASVDGRALRMMVDTGATLCAFDEMDAERLGITVRPGDFNAPMMTANGLVRVAPVRIGLIRIGPVAVRDVEAVVIPRGRLGGSLLGMSFLRRLREFSVSGTSLTLRGV